MAEAKINILIVGAGKGGAALVEMFCNSETVNIIGIADINRDAPGIKLAKELNIPAAEDYKEFLDKKELDEIINVTGSEKVHEELFKHKPANVEVMGGHSAKLMWLLIEERKASGEELKRNYETQSVIDSLLRLSLENITSDEFLERSLKKIISIPWLSFESRGAIFLSEGESEILVMKAQSGLPEPILKSCARVPFGKCLCGKAALTKAIQFSNTLDERHEIRYEGITSHGHYCVPIVFGAKLLGVINMYIKEGRIREKKDEDFLIAVANTIAGVIERKRVEDERKKAYDKLKETQRDLIQSEKLAALGRFSTGLAHEVKNPLGIILGGIEYLEQKLPPPGEDIKLAFEKVKEAIFRADNILVGLLKFSRPSELKMEKVSLRDLVNEALSFYKYRAPLININIETQFDDDEKSVEVDKNQMQQVIFNVLLNAVEAMPQGGNIKIRTCKKMIPTLSLKNQFCVIEIKDSGTGISRENQTRIFEPFFTTKRDKKGTGLGLAVAKMIMENHKGNLMIESEMGKGTTVNIILPC